MKLTYTILFLVFLFNPKIEAQNSECVFTTDIKPVAIDLISKFQNIDQWEWSESDSAILAETKASDSIVLKVSGCIHISYNFNLQTSSGVSDWILVRNKLLIYINQKVDTDVFKILTNAKKENIDIINSDGKTFISFNSYPVQDIPGNLIFSPIVVESDNNSTSIKLSWYYN